MPEELARLYEEHLRSLGKYDEARNDSPADREIVGGPSDTETVRHFTHRFAASMVRIEYLVLDPASQFKDIPSDLLVTLSDGRAAILDAPCGAGAGIISLLGTVAELRDAHCAPTLPLTLHVTAGDCSAKALQLYGQLLERLRPWLNRQAITITWNTEHWDATQPNSTAELVDIWFRNTARAEEHLVLIAAFSGAGDRLFQDCSRSFQHIAERLHDKRGKILWVEPQWGKGERFFEKVERLFTAMPWFDSRDAGSLSGAFDWLHPIKNVIIQGSVLVRKYSRG